MCSSPGQLEALEDKQSRNSWVCEDMDFILVLYCSDPVIRVLCVQSNSVQTFASMTKYMEVDPTFESVKCGMKLIDATFVILPQSWTDETN